MAFLGNATALRRKGLITGAAFVLSLSAATGAMADCNGTGLFAPGAAGPFNPAAILPFASGGAVNSLISAINTANTAFLTQSTAFVSAPANPAPNQEGGGVWGRAIGGDITTKSTSTTSNVTFAGAAIPGTVACNNETKLTFGGAQVGSDTSILNYGAGGWNIHVGATAGYLGATAKDQSSAGVLNPLGGTFQDQLQVPFAGVYAAATKGGFFIDGMLRTDYYQNNLNDPVVSGLFNQKLDARGVAFSGNVGYNYALGNNWFVEPSAGIVVSRVKVDALSVTGTLVTGTGVGFPGQLHVNDINTDLGRLSVRAGTSFQSGSWLFQPFVIGSVYHDFAGNITASFDGTNVPLLGGVLPAGQISTTNVGTYGQVGAGLSAQLVNSGLLGYIRADYRDGDNIHGFSLNGGVRYQFTPEFGVGSPMYTKAVKAAPLLDAAYNWTGFFIGASAGVANGDTNWNAPTIAGTANPRFAGVLGGAQIGYDQQFGKWVVGVEGNINGTNARGARNCLNFLDTCEDSVHWIGTATARLGYALWNRSLFYVRAGAAFDESNITSSCNAGPFAIAVFALTNCGVGETRTRFGWTAGFGSEFALARNWTVRTETNYFNMGTQRYNLPAPPIPIDVKQDGFISTVGLNYRFSAGPAVIAKY